MRVWSQTLCLLALALLWAGCSAPVVETPTRVSQPVTVSVIDSYAQFENLSVTIGNERFTKFIVDIGSGEVYFFDVELFPMHIDYVFEVLRPQERYVEHVARFEQNYGPDKPDFLLGILVHHLDQDLWTLSFWAGDEVTPGHVAMSLDALDRAFYATDRVSFRPDSTLQETMASGLRDIPVVTNDALYRASDYRAFVEGSSVGRLRIARDVEGVRGLAPEDVVILTTPVPELSVVAGVITETFSTPLSHVALRARSWGIPHAGLRGAAEQFEGLEGQWVYLETGPRDLVLRPATAEEIAAWQARTPQPATVVAPDADLSIRDLTPLQDMAWDDARAFGAKAANLGAIAQIAPDLFTVPDGFGIPVAYYDDHLKRHGLDKVLAALLADQALLADSTRRQAALADLRASIREAPIDEALLDAVMAATDTLELHDGGGVFVRSSTTAEDLPGFNGAGLYDTVPNVRGREAMADAIGQVWASVYNDRAFEERAFFGMDHLSVYGGVLIQVGVPAESAGVLVTRNVYTGQSEGQYTLSAQKGLGMRVVDGRAIPEQLVYDKGTGGIKVISRSDDAVMLIFSEDGGIEEIANPSPGQPVLTDARVRALGAAAERIERVFPGDQDLDIEWLFVDDLPVIVQVRPFLEQTSP